MFTKGCSHGQLLGGWTAPEPFPKPLLPRVALGRTSWRMDWRKVRYRCKGMCIRASCVSLEVIMLAGADLREKFRVAGEL